MNSQGKLSARATKLESDTRRSNFAIGWKFRQSLSCYTANVGLCMVGSSSAAFAPDHPLFCARARVHAGGNRRIRATTQFARVHNDNSFSWQRLATLLMG